MEFYTLDVYKTTESLVIKGFSSIQNLLTHNLGFQNCIKDGKNIDPDEGAGVNFEQVIVLGPQFSGHEVEDDLTYIVMVDHGALFGILYFQTETYRADALATDVRVRGKVFF